MIAMDGKLLVGASRDSYRKHSGGSGEEYVIGQQLYYEIPPRVPTTRCIESALLPAMNYVGDGALEQCVNERCKR